MLSSDRPKIDFGSSQLGISNASLKGCERSGGQTMEGGLGVMDEMWLQIARLKRVDELVLVVAVVTLVGGGEGGGV